MKGLLRRRKLLVIALAAVIMVVLGRLFLNAPVPHIQIAAEPIGHSIFGRWDITNSLIAAWVAMAVILLAVWLATRRMRDVPGRFQGLVEATIQWFLGLVEGVAGKSHGRRFFPLVATLFIFILIANWTSLVPLFGTIGKVEPAYELIAKNEVVEKVSPRIGYTVEEYEAGHIAADERDLRIATELNFASQRDPRVKSQLAGIKLQVFDKAGGARLLPVGYGIKKEMTGWEYVQQVSQGDFSAGKEAGVLVPYLRGMNTDLNSTLAMAILAMVMVQYWGVQAHGFGRYFSRFFQPKWLLKPPMGWVRAFVGALEALSQVLQIVSLSFRLFGNMLAGEILIFSFVFLIPLLFALLGFGLELIVGFMQAVVFAALALLWASLAVTGHGEEGHGEKAPEHAKE